MTACINYCTTRLGRCGRGPRKIAIKVMGIFGNDTIIT